DLSRIVFYFVAHTENFHEIPDFVRLANSLNVTKVVIGNYLISVKEHLSYSLLNVKSDYNLVVDEAIKLGKELGITVVARKFFNEQERPRSKCTKPFDEVFIKPNGDVGPCCFSGNYLMGNVYETSFEDVWFSAAYRKLREKRHLPACRGCTPFVPFDSFCAHFTGDFRVSEEFKEFEEQFAASSELTT
ncbi:MAG: SPASM domain-containing protein, partial [Desulfomonilaceae bacterium]